MLTFLQGPQKSHQIIALNLDFKILWFTFGPDVAPCVLLLLIWMIMCLKDHLSSRHTPKAQCGLRERITYKHSLGLGEKWETGTVTGSVILQSSRHILAPKNRARNVLSFGSTSQCELSSSFSLQPSVLFSRKPIFLPSWTLLNKTLGYMLFEQHSQPVSSLEKFGGLRYISILKVLVSFHQRWELIQSPWKLISYKSECIPFYVSKAIITDFISNHCYSGLVMLWDNALRYPRSHFTWEGISL